jgi:hypothetical protein
LGYLLATFSLLATFAWFDCNMVNGDSSVGVKVGDWMIYNEVTTRNGTIPSPQYNRVSHSVNITAVSGTNIGLHTVIFLENSDTIAADYVLDVQSATVYNSTVPGAELSWLVLPGLSAGDKVSMLVGGQPTIVEINETTYRQYLNATSEVNHVEFADVSLYPMYQKRYDLYYFRRTGILAEMSLNQTTTQFGITQNLSTRIAISATDIIAQS